MPVQIFQQPGFGERLGQALGTGLGTGLGGSLQNLAQLQMQNLMQRRQMQQRMPGLQALGFSPEQAGGLALLDPAIQKEAIRMREMQQRVTGLQRLFPNYGIEELLGLAALDPRSLSKAIEQQQLQAVQRPADIAIEEILGAPPAQPRTPDQLTGAPREEIGVEEIVSPLAAPRRAPEELKKEEVISPRAIDPGKPPRLQEEKQPFKTPEAQEIKKELDTIPHPPPIPTEKLPPGAKADRELQALERRIARGDLTPAQAKEMRKRIGERSEEYLKQQEKIDKKTDPYYSEVNSVARATEEGLQRTARMEKLVRDRTLPFPETATFIDALAEGIPIPFTKKSIGVNLKPIFYSPDAQEFEKLSKDFLKNAKQFFGARVTQKEVEMFLETIPTLMQTDLGKLAVIRNIDLFGEANIARKRAMDEVIEDYGGYRPHNLEKLAEERAKPFLDAIARDFRNGVLNSHRHARVLADDRLPTELLRP